MSEQPVIGAEEIPNYRTPEQEAAIKGVNAPRAYEVPVEELNPLNAHLFKENRWAEVFERLRAEDPVHLNELDLSGRYWSLTRYEDIVAVDKDWETFSSAHGITLGFELGAEVPQGVFVGTNSPFIAQDPPTHGGQRKTVNGVVSPTNLAKLEPLRWPVATRGAWQWAGGACDAKMAFGRQRVGVQRAPENIVVVSTR